MSKTMDDIPTTVKEDPRKSEEVVSDLEEEEDDLRAKIFPQRLMEILSDERNSDAITWLPHGRAFIIRSRKVFAEKVMPRYFSRKSKYSSFTRKLNRWNFVRISSGRELGAYYHEFFLRDKPHLAAQMFCKNARAKLAMSAAGESNAAIPEPAQASPITNAAAAGGGGPPPAQMTPRLPAMDAFALQQIAIEEQLAKEQLVKEQLAKEQLVKEQLVKEQLAKLHMLEQMSLCQQQADPTNMLLLEALACGGPSMLSQTSTPQMLRAQLAMQQSQARLMQMKNLMALKSRQGTSSRPINHRASAA